MAEYLKRDIARILKKRPNTIEFYTASGLVIPDIEPSQGKGVPRVYSGRNLMEFGMIEVMSRIGTTLSTAKNVLSILRKGEWHVPEEDRPISDKKKKGIFSLGEAQYDVSFKDFWTSEKWGLTEELFFVEVRDLSPSGELFCDVYVYVQEKPMEEYVQSEASMTTVLWLGRIKKAAVQLVFG